MKRVAMSIVALACMCCFVANVNAGGDCCKAKAAGTTVAAKDGAGCCSGKSEFPTMKIMVGDKAIGCCKEAEKVAKESKAKVIYVVAGEKYECKDEAGEAYAEAAEVFADHFTSVACVVNGNPIYCNSNSTCSTKGATKVAAKSEGSGCCMSKGGDKAKTGASETTKVAAKSEGNGECTGKSGETSKVAAKSEGKGDCCMSKAANVKYLVLGKTFDKMADAEKARDEVMVAVKKVSMKAMVDGKEVSCDEVCPMAEKAGKVAYMVNGEKVECKIMARVKLAKAKYEAAKTAAADKKMASAK